MFFTDPSILIIEQFKPYVVEQEIRQLDKSGGDSAQRAGHFWFMTTAAGIPDQVIEEKLGITYEGTMQSHETADGWLYRRTGQPGIWDSEPRNFTRDQWNGMQLAWAVRGDKKRLIKSMLGLCARLGFHQNYHVGLIDKTVKWWQIYKIPDLAHPSHLSVFIRGMDLWFLKPLLYVLDLVLVGDVYARENHIWDADNMLLPHMIYANMKYQTPVGRWALEKYLKTDFEQRLRHYHSIGLTEGGDQMNGIGPMPDLFMYTLKHRIVHKSR